MKMNRWCRILKIVFVIFVAPLSLLGCEDNDQELKMRGMFGGEHALHKMAERTETESKISGGFFLLVGGLSGNSETKVSVKFAWLMNDKQTYALSSLPLEKIRVRFDEDTSTPTITFHWLPLWFNSCIDRNNIQGTISERVNYAVITTRAKDWPQEVNLPLNSKQ